MSIEDIIRELNSKYPDKSKAVIEFNSIIKSLLTKDKKANEPIDIRKLVRKFPIIWDTKDNIRFIRPKFKSDNEYIEYLHGLNINSKPHELPSYSPRFSLSNVHNFDKDWINFDRKQVSDIIDEKSAKENKDMYGVSYYDLHHLIEENPIILDFLVDSFNWIVNSETELCDEWYRACTIIARYKTGDVTKVSNFRPLMTFSLVVSMFDSLLSRKLKKVLNDHSIIDTNVQMAFLKDYSGLWESIYSVNKKLHEIDDSKICLFIDIKNAYGSVEYDTLIFILEKYNFSPKFTRYIKFYYMNSFATFNKTCFKWNNGLYQGSGLSNILFLIYIDFCLKNLFQELKMTKTIAFEYDLQENSFAFVDDIALFVPVENIDNIIKLIQEIFMLYGLQINQEKTYFIMNNRDITEIKSGCLTFNRATVDFLYLGINLSIFEDEFLNSVYEKIFKCCTKIDNLMIDPSVKLYIYYIRIFIRITRLLECYYIIYGKTPKLEEIMINLGNFISKWTKISPVNYMNGHIEYIELKGKEKLRKMRRIVNSIELSSDSINYNELFGGEPPNNQMIENDLKNVIKSSHLNEEDDENNDTYGEAISCM